MATRIGPKHRKALRAIDDVVLRSGFSKRTMDIKEARAQYGCRLSDDVDLRLRVEFYDGGPIVGRDITWLTGEFGFVSRPLLEIYKALNGGLPSDEYKPASGSLEKISSTPHKRGWMFEGTEYSKPLGQFQFAIDGPLRSLAEGFATTSLQIEHLFSKNFEVVSWSWKEFFPVAHIYLRQYDKALRCAEEILHDRSNPEFFQAYYLNFFENLKSYVRCH